MAVSTEARHESFQDLVGRSAELNSVLRQAGRAGAGAAQALLVRGPAGIGRSSLLAAAATRLRGDGFTVRTVRGGSAPGRVVDALTGPAEPAATGLSAPSPDLYANCLRFYGQVRRLLADGPLAIVLDDAQWCDETSLRCLGFVLRRAAAQPLLVLLAQRTESDGPGTAALAELLAQDRCTLLELGPMSESGTGRMTGRVLGGPVDPLFARRCAEICGGNPQLLGRLLAGLRTAGIRPDRGGLRRLRTVYRGILASLIPDFLAVQPRPVQQVATALAVLGRAEPDLLGALSGAPARHVETALGVLRRFEAVAPAGRGPVMREPLRRTVLAGLPAGTLHDLRARAARLLNDAGRPAAEVVGQLVFLDRIDEPWMLAVLRDAIAESPGRAATKDVVACLRRALAAQLTVAERKDVHRELARACAPTAPASALRHLHQALAAAPDAREKAAIAVDYGLSAAGTSQAAHAARTLGDVLDALDSRLGTDLGPADRELRTTVASALLFTALNDTTAMSAARERALTWALPHGDSPAERQLLAATSVMACLEGRPAGEVAALARRAIRVEDAAPAAGWWVLGPSTVLGLADAVDDALAGMERLCAGGLARHGARVRVPALAGRSVALHDAGDIAGALRQAQAALVLAERDGQGGPVPMAHIALGSALVSAGRSAEACVVLDRLVRTDVALERRLFEWHHYLYARGRALREQGDLEGALAVWRRCGRSLEAAGVANPLLAPWWLPAATTLARLGRAAEAAEVVEQAQPGIRRWGTSRALGLGLLAAACVAEGRTRLRLLGDSVDALTASPARLELCKAEFQLGRELLRHGDTDGARRHLRRVIERATHCGYHLLAGIARRLLVTAGGRMPQLAASPLDSLTGGERRVAALARDGASNKKIAETLFITTRTVEMHLTNVYRKLGVRGRTELPGGLRTAGLQATGR
ncbi:helix-turn-helix transcriptional regulator [Streptomyces rectiverticillatus]|uniref:helix-turn-helix transcriptional regulator n=1 Tax=Streptomyces rectiverticillatus TaxID=173860 RepID=UPI0015C31B75|nr:LuxR family transcriptional regulator [Streptomyces rectiverticillatus]